VPDRSRFAVFVLTHGRPDRVLTLGALRRAGYTGRTYLVIDNEDARGDEYRETFGADSVIEFDKAAIAETFDTADTFEDRRAIAYARNACYGIAEELGLDYFLELDDDYHDFLYRYRRGLVIGSTMIRSMDRLIEGMLAFLDETGAMSVAFSQGGDHIGGVEGSIGRGLLRKAMNSFFLRTDRPVRFLGRLNEDVNTYTLGGSRGELYLTLTGLQLNQTQTQQQGGGMTEVYRASGTYVKSFYSVMMCPSFVRIRTMGRFDRRYHHSIEWDHAVPKILHERYRVV